MLRFCPELLACFLEFSIMSHLYCYLIYYLFRASIILIQPNELYFVLTRNIQHMSKVYGSGLVLRVLYG